MLHTRNSTQRYMHDASTTSPKSSTHFPSPSMCPTRSHLRHSSPLVISRLHRHLPSNSLARGQPNLQLPCLAIHPHSVVHLPSIVHPRAHPCQHSTPLTKHLTLLRNARHRPHPLVSALQDLDLQDLDLFCLVPSLFPCRHSFHLQFSIRQFHLLRYLTQTLPLACSLPRTAQLLLRRLCHPRLLIQSLAYPQPLKLKYRHLLKSQ